MTELYIYKDNTSIFFLMKWYDYKFLLQKHTQFSALFVEFFFIFTEYYIIINSFNYYICIKRKQIVNDLTIEFSL